MEINIDLDDLKEVEQNYDKLDNFEKIKTNFLGKQYKRYCEDCKYHNPNGLCKHPYKEWCKHSELWTPKNTIVAQEQIYL